MIKGNIIWLNGGSSTGKSSLAIALQKQLPQPYYCIAQDTFTDIIAPWLSGNYRGMEADELWYSAVEAMYYTIKLYSDLGRNVIVDHVVLNQEDGKEQQYFREAMKLLEGYPIMLIKVNCSLEELKRREIARGDIESGCAEVQFKKGLYPASGYQLEVDTSVNTSAECAELIIKIMEENKMLLYEKLLASLDNFLII